MLRAIWAQTHDRVIGDGYDMPWYLPEDLAHFKNTTLDHPIIMGRATWESLPRRPLPGRDNIILSTRPPGDWSTGATVTTEPPQDGWIIGGGQVYASTLPLVDAITMTLIDAHLAPLVGDGAVFAPDITGIFTIESETDWLTSERGIIRSGDGVDSSGVGGNKTPLRYKYITYVRT